jgi:glycosyltransferase involved in cell wall biosynthesis
MRILQITPVYYPELQFGGPPQKIHSLSQRLADRGHEVRVVTLDSRRRSAAYQATVEGIPVQYLAWVGRKAWQVPLSWGALTHAVGWAEVVHAYGLYNLLCPLAARQAQRRDTPFVIEPQGMATARAGNLTLKRLYHRSFTAYLLRVAASVIVTSPAEADDLRGVVSSDRLVIRRNGIDLNLFRSLPPGDGFRSQFGIADSARLALFVGRISPIKNLEMLVRAFAQARVPDSRLALVGPMLEPDYATHLRAVCSELAVSDAVLFTGPLYGHDKLTALAAADLFVLPSLFESFGNAAAEAVAAGLPILLTETCGIAPLIHNRCGLAVPVSVDALAEGMHQLMTEPSRCSAVTAQREAVMADLSIDEPIDQMENLYSSPVQP